MKPSILRSGVDLYFVLTLLCCTGLKEDSGMGLKEVAIEHKTQRLIRRHQLAISKDRQVMEIHGFFSALQHRKKTNALCHQWLECVEMDELLAEMKTG